VSAPPAIKPLSDHSSLQERTYRALREAIVLGQFAPGQRLHEKILADLLGVSRNPVREAIRRLQQDGFVDVRPRTGIFVASYSLAEIQDLYRVRAALEGTAAALAAERMSDGEIEQLGAVLRRMEQATEARAKRATVHEADAFHQCIHQGARSPRLAALLAQLYGQIAHYRNVTLGLPGRASQASHGHHDLLDAIRRRDAGEADRMMREHVLGAATALMDHLASSTEKQAAPDGSPPPPEYIR
jgi:DNA-binding GntR family transcriptional regulator